MFDYTIEDAQRILKSFDSADLRLSNHVLDNWFKRDTDFDYIFNCLKDNNLLSISKTSKNRFKLIYPHKISKAKDFYVIIEIDDFEKITVITAYSFSNSRRQRENER
jgi:hypothetical protein